MYGCILFNFNADCEFRANSNLKEKKLFPCLLETQSTYRLYPQKQVRIELNSDLLKPRALHFSLEVVGYIFLYIGYIFREIL